MDEFEPCRWYRILDPRDGGLWMETSDLKEALRESEWTGWPIERLWIKSVYEWRSDLGQRT